MAKKGESTFNYGDGRKLFKAKDHKHIRLNDWPAIKYKKITYNTGYSILVRLKDTQDLWIQLHRCVVKRDKKIIYIEPHYYETNFSDIPCIIKVKKKTTN